MQAKKSDFMLDSIVYSKKYGVARSTSLIFRHDFINCRLRLPNSECKPSSQRHIADVIVHYHQQLQECITFPSAAPTLAAFRLLQCRCHVPLLPHRQSPSLSLALSLVFLPSFPVCRHFGGQRAVKLTKPLFPSKGEKGIGHTPFRYGSKK